MSNTCSIDRGFGQFGTLWSEMPTPLTDSSGRPELFPRFVGGHLNALWSVGPSNRPALVVSSWDPRLLLAGSFNFRALRIVLFPSDGHPDGFGRTGGTRHLFLSDFNVHCEYLDSDDDGSNSFLVAVREMTGQPGPWAYSLRRISLPSEQKNNFPLLPDWLYEPSEVAPMGNLKIKIDRSNASRAALVSTQGGSLRVSLLTIGPTVAATTTDFSSVVKGVLIHSSTFESSRLTSSVVISQ